jgi:hypothetical protein
MWKETIRVVGCLAIVIAGAFAMERFLYWKRQEQRTLAVPPPAVVDSAASAQTPAHLRGVQHLSPNAIRQMPNGRMFEEMLRVVPPETRARILKGMPLAELGPVMLEGVKHHKLAAGTPAPDFVLPGVQDGQKVHLADQLGKKPVVLLFGSFTCHVFCGQFASLVRLHEKYRDRAEFLFIYIAESPHPDPLPPPTAPEDRLGRIRRGLERFKLPFRCLVDGPDATVQHAYSVLAQGLIIVDRKGRIAFDAGVGFPGGWNLEDAEATLQRFPPVP